MVVDSSTLSRPSLGFLFSPVTAGKSTRCQFELTFFYRSSVQFIGVQGKLLLSWWSWQHVLDLELLLNSAFAYQDLALDIPDRLDEQSYYYIRHI